MQLFELLGMDILVDEERRVWLCEVNHMPDIGCTSRKFSQVYKSDFNVKARTTYSSTRTLCLNSTRAHM